MSIKPFDGRERTGRAAQLDENDLHGPGLNQASAVRTDREDGPSGGQAREHGGYVPTVALANLGVYMALLTPVMVSMAFKIQHLVGDERASGTLGTVMAIGALFALLFNPLAGRLSDRTTSRLGMRRPWVLGGSLIGFAALVLVGTAGTVLMVAVGWCLAQMAFNAVLAAANATIPDQVPPERRGKVSGLVGIATPLAIFIGTIVVDWFSSDTLRFAVPAGIGLITAWLFAAFLRDRKLSEKPGPFGFKEFLGAFYFNPRKHADFGWTWLTKFLIMFGYAGIATFLPLYLTSRFDMPEKNATSLIMYATMASTVAMVISSPLGGWLSDKIQMRRPFVTVAGLIMVVGLVVLALAPVPGFIVVGQAIVGLGAGSFFSVDTALATLVLPNKKDIAKDLGVLNMANALPQSLAPAMAPAVLAIGANLPTGQYPTWYLFGALVALAGAMLVYKIKGVR